jgi:hypothetical protein
MSAGRSFRLLLAFGLALAMWLALRLPVLERELATRHPERLLPEPATRLTQVAAYHTTDVAIASAEVAVAEAALALAEARLRLTRVRAGMPVPPVAVTMASAPAVVAPARAARAVASTQIPGLNPGWTLALPDAPPAASGPRGPTPEQVAITPKALPASTPGHDLATAAYARLAAGDRRSAVALFDAALASEPAPGDAALRPLWTAERRRLVRRWSGDAYTLLRDAGPAGPAASPVLGGGQSGGTLAWTPDPLARRPLAIVARYNAASLGGSIDPATGQAAFGVRWRPVAGVNVSAERLVATGTLARDDWALRIAGGADGKKGRVLWSGYGEAGVLGAGDVFAGAQLRAGVPVLQLGKFAFVAGPGSWASFQHGSGFTSGRVDIGPTLLLRAPMGKLSVDIMADWRFRVAGNALPGSGPALTLSTGF